MKKNLLSGLFVAAAVSASSQVQQVLLDTNNVSALISSDGVFFTNQQDSSPDYEVPKNSGNNAIYTFQIGARGRDFNGQLFESYTYYGINDFTCGPMVEDYDDYSSAAYQSAYANKVWPMDSWTIQQHQANWNQSGYIVPQTIAEWPGNGTVIYGVQAPLAPYVDYNQNGTYDPENGDYPDIRGNKAIFQVLNDENVPPNNAAGTELLHMELQIMTYQYATDDVLKDVTFMNVKAIERETMILDSFQLNLFTNFDLGNNLDDYCGTDVGRKLVYAYNGDNYDEASFAGPGYGANPPAVGMLSLDHTFRTSVFPTALPTATALRDVYDGYNSDYTLITYNGAQTKLQYSDTISSGGFNEIAAANPPGDRYSFVSLSPLELQLGPFRAECYNFAFIYANKDGGGRWQDVDSLMKVADFVQDFYDTYFTCPGFQLSLSEQELQTLKLYPNPSGATFHLDGVAAGAIVSIVDLNGRILKTQQYDSAAGMAVSELAPGTYLIKAESGGKIWVTRFVKQ